MSQIHRCRDLEDTGRFPLRRLERSFAQLDFASRDRTMMEILLARFGHAQFAGRALDQADAEALFQSRHLGADRRLGHAQASRGGRETTGLHDLHEYGDCIHGHIVQNSAQ